MPWSINQALDVVKWIIETHGGNDDLQAWRQICAYIAEAEKPSHNSQITQCCAKCKDIDICMESCDMKVKSSCFRSRTA